MIISLSGGLDSTTLLYHAIDQTEEVIQPIIFLYNQKHRKEVECARLVAAQARIKFGDRVKVPLRLTVPLTICGALTDPNQPVPTLEETVGHPQPPTYVPFRNLVFSSLALHYAEALGHTCIALGIHKSDMYGYWDTSQEFLTALGKLADLNRQKKFHFWCPFIPLTKAGIVTEGLRLGVPFQHTWSCYQGNHYPCRRCATCREREAAFESNGDIDPLLVSAPPNA